MMRGLRIDIPHQRRSIAQPNRERRIASLQPNRANSGPFVLIHFDDETFTRSTRCAIDSFRASNSAM